MYSNEINAFFLFFFFMILCSAPLISSKKSLSQDYYNNTCPRLDDMVWWGVVNATIYDPRMPASLLRLHFHDCFVNGCDASVLLDDTNGEQTARPNQNSLRGFEVIDSIKADVEKWCPPKTVSCADILSLAARAAVNLALLHPDQPWYDQSQPWPVVLGRLDGLVPNKTGAESDLPTPFDPVDTLISKFAAKGLNTQDMVVLSGNIIPHHMYFYHMYLAPLDGQTPTTFDKSYYNNLLNKAGVLLSDQALASDIRTSKMVNDYSNHQELFMKDFGVSMVKMGNIDVIMTRGKTNGEIRRNCGSPNSINEEQPSNPSIQMSTTVFV